MKIKKIVFYAVFFIISAFVSYLLGAGLIQIVISCLIATIVFAFITEKYFVNR